MGCCFVTRALRLHMPRPSVIALTLTMAAPTLSAVENPGCDACNVRLSSGTNGTALEFDLNTPASDPDMTAQIAVIDTALHYYYHSIPDNEYLYFDTSRPEKHELNYTLINKATAAFDYTGQLTSKVLPEDMPAKQKKHLLFTLEQALKLLANFNNKSFEELEENSTALIVIHDTHSVITLYSASEAIIPLVEITIPSEGKERITVMDDSWSVTAESPSGAQATTQQEAPSKELKIISLQVAPKERMLQKVLSHLGGILDAANSKDIRPGLLKLGFSGELAWKKTTKNTPPVKVKAQPKRMEATPEKLSEIKAKKIESPPEPPKFTSVSKHLPPEKIQFSTVMAVPNTGLTVVLRDLGKKRIPVVDISNITDASQALAAINTIYNEVNKLTFVPYGIFTFQTKELQIWISPETHSSLKNLIARAESPIREGLNVSAADKSNFSAIKRAFGNKISDFKKNLIESKYHDDHLDFKPQPVKTDDHKSDKQSSSSQNTDTDKNQKSLDSQESFLKQSAQAFALHAAVGGGIGAGFHIYDHYQKNQTLPHQYNRDEWGKLALTTLKSSTRHGINGVISQGLINAGLPPAVAGATMGAANALYDSYYNGDWLRYGLISVVANASAEGVISNAGSFMGRKTATYIPLIGQALPVQITATIAGSLLGHSAYQYLLENGMQYRR